MQTNILLWTMGKTWLGYPHAKRLEPNFSTKLFTLSTTSVEKFRGKMGNKCVFCGNLKSPKNRHSIF